ncbi:hypothetical protein [Roseivirga echinicomitans]|uniref:DUF4468 domain-containing protein n=1 Tax=Roseivirga echinicomitans TaxID=296218 RepID=A0A150XUD6_9BACT|nr:hypothetical protein [Roseivirga echinicomitans]KYG82350.1 hypothetical protein AWN68_16070 [Roseivirga echinicomitans]
MKLYVYVLVLLSFMAFGVNAQTFPSELWHEGQVNLTDGSVKSGNIKYDLDRQTVQLKIGQRNETYDASQVTSFSFLQESINARRMFYSLPYAIQNNYRRPVFFEVVVTGKMTLLAREYVVVRSNNTPSSLNSRYRYLDYSGFNGSRSYLSYKMFFAKEDGTIRESSGKKNDVLYQFGEARSELKKYVKKEKLKLDRLEDVAKLVEYYNKEIN